MPAKVNGKWIWRMSGKDYRVDLAQTFQKVAGSLTAVDAKTSLDQLKLSGDALTFEARLPGPGGTQTMAFDGKVIGDAIEATVVMAGRTSKVTAKRAP